MKRILFYFFLALITLSGFSQSTTGKVLSQGIDLRSVFFTSINMGYTVGSSGVSYMKVYPNPANDIITIEASSRFVQGNLSVSNLSGQNIISCQITQVKMQIDLSGLPAGVYFIRLTSDKNVATGKFIKQ